MCSLSEQSHLQSHNSVVWSLSQGAAAAGTTLLLDSVKHFPSCLSVYIDTLEAFALRQCLIFCTAPALVVNMFCKTAAADIEKKESQK